MDLWTLWYGLGVYVSLILLDFPNPLPLFVHRMYSSDSNALDGGPEVPLSPSIPPKARADLSAYFKAHFLHLWNDYFTLPIPPPWWVPRSNIERPSIMHRRRPKVDSRFPSIGVPHDILVICEPDPWMNLEGEAARFLRRDLFAMVHKTVSLRL